MKSKSQFESVPKNTNKSEFHGLVRIGDGAFLVDNCHNMAPPATVVSSLLCSHFTTIFQIYYCNRTWLLCILSYLLPKHKHFRFRQVATLKVLCNYPFFYCAHSVLRVFSFLYTKNADASLDTSSNPQSALWIWYFLLCSCFSTTLLFVLAELITCHPPTLATKKLQSMPITESAQC